MSMSIDQYVTASDRLTEADRRLATLVRRLSEANRRIDPYRPFLQFLLGHLTFTGVILVGALASLPKTGAELTSPMRVAMGGVVAWMAISALAGSIIALIIQGLKLRFIRLDREPADAWIKTSFALCLVPIVPGAIAVLYCLLAGAALISNANSLPSIVEAFETLRTGLRLS